MSGAASFDALLLDLDDTLYEEGSYIRSGLRAVAGNIAEAAGRPREEVTRHLLETLETAGRCRIFDRCLPAFGLEPSIEAIAGLVEAYRSHRPDIGFYPGVSEMLARLRRRFRLAVVTDGLPRMQRAKVLALGLEALVDAVVYTWELDRPKPAVDGFLAALAALGGTSTRSLIVGDNPDHDLAAAVALDMAAARVRTGRFGACPNPPGVRLFRDLALVTELEPLLMCPPPTLLRIGRHL